MKRLLCAALASGLAAPAFSQNLGDYTNNPQLGIRYQMPKKLKRIPLNPADIDPYTKDQWKPIDAGDFVQTKFGPFDWELNVLVFEKTPQGPGVTTGGGDPKEGGEEPGDDGKDKGKKPPRPGLDDIKKLRAAGAVTSFAAWVEKEARGADRKFVSKGTKEKKLADKLSYKLWDYRDARGTTAGKITFANLGAVFDFPEREIVFLAELPEDGLKKFEPLITATFDSVRRSVKEKEEAGKGATDLYKFATTPERKESVDKARDGIKGFDNWGIYPTPSYICIYSFAEGKQDKSFEFAKGLADKLEKIRELYKRDFPPYEGMKLPYSVLRVCSKKEEFDQYGGTSGGVVGWFNPGSKELVVFNGKSLLGSGETETITFHEGWHQYCDSYFGIELQRWFDEGHGDYFGSFIPGAGGAFNYQSSKMRRVPLLDQVRQKTYVPIRDLVNWNKDKFYGANAVKYYEQAYGIIDFLRRGSKTSYWKKEWANILPTYIKTARETKDPVKAVEAAFAGVDMQAFEDSWAEYCRKEI